MDIVRAAGLEELFSKVLDMGIDKIVVIGHIDTVAPKVLDDGFFGDYLMLIGDEIDQQVVFLLGEIGTPVGSFDDLFLQVEGKFVQHDPVPASERLPADDRRDPGG